MDTRDSPEQAELRRAARRMARTLGPATVVDLDDEARARRLTDALRDAGWLELRDDAGDGRPLASGVEVAIVADALGGAAADVAFSGPILAADLARRAGIPAEQRGAVAFAPHLGGVAVTADGATLTDTYAVDAGPMTERAHVLVPDGPGWRLGRVRLDPSADDGPGTDLTRTVRGIPAGTSVGAVAEQTRLLTSDDLAGWNALGLALTCADLVGTMRGLLDLTVAYATDRRQYGVPVGSFQSVQHLLAEARCLMEGSLSTALHAAWSVDHRDPEAAREAGRVAKAYASRAARTVGETAIQVHGGIGNTWECIVHVYVRRALLSTQWFGDDAVQLSALARDRLGVADGLP